MTQIDSALHNHDWFSFNQSQKDRTIAGLQQTIKDELPNSILVRYEKVDCYA